MLSMCHDIIIPYRYALSTYIYNIYIMHYQHINVLILKTNNIPTEWIFCHACLYLKYLRHYICIEINHFY